MRQRLYFVLIFCFVTLVATAQSTKTSRAFTGREWNNVWSDEMKTSYVMGLQDGLIIGIRETAGNNKELRDNGINKCFPKTIFSRGEYMSALESFYVDPSNILIPVGNAFYLVTQKFKGVTKQELDDLLKYYRRISAKQ
jgi:hypothetical protein